MVTLVHGAFEAREVLKRCGDSSSCPVIRSETLARTVPRHQRYGYDLIVHVGLARYLGGRQRAEISDNLLRQRGIRVSDATVSNLCDRFLARLEALHLRRAADLRTALSDGYPMHLDATSDRGKGGLFVCMDGWRGWVLLASRIPSERGECLRPIVDRTVALFGDPVATVRDLGEAGAYAVKPLAERGVPDLGCHYHFLAAVGKKLFDLAHSSLRNILRKTGVRRDLRALLRELRRYQASSDYEGRFGPGPVRDDLAALVLWVIEGNGTKAPRYPFSLPHLDLVQRGRDVSQRAEDWVPCPRTQTEWRVLNHLSGIVARPMRAPRHAEVVQRLEAAWRAFSELRDLLRLSNAELPGGDPRVHQAVLPDVELRRLKAIEKAVDQHHAELRQQVEQDDGGRRAAASPQAVVLDYLDRYRHLLFGHPVLRDEDGSVLAVVERTNNIAEHFFGDDKHGLRRRVGRAHLGRDLEQQPAQAAYVHNLRHPDYVRVLCGSLDNLPDAFAQLDAVGPVAVSLLRDNRDSQLMRRVRALLDGNAANNGNGSQAGLPRHITAATGS